MKMQISELANAVGVSVRTLQYYDKIGLLPPTEILENGYRVYDDSSLDKLKKILYYKQMDFSLKKVSQLISSESDNVAALAFQRKSLLKKRHDLDKMLESIEKQMSETAVIEPWFDRVLNEYNYSGCSYFTNGNDHFCAWRMADYENGIGFTPALRFPLFGITEQFTSVCILALCQEGRLGLDTLLSDLLPEEKKRKDFTVLHLLKGEQSEDYNHIKRCFVLLGNILERLCMKPLSQIFYDMIFQPLGMPHTSLGGKNPDIIGYDSYNDPVPYSMPANGAEGAVSAIDDMVIFYEALLNGKLLHKPFSNMLTNNEEYFFGGFFKSGARLSHSAYGYLISIDTELNTENNDIYIGIRNNDPIPDNGDRLIYYVINGCDDGYAKFEVWTMESGTEVILKDIRIFDENANELYCVSSDKPLINVRNDGERRHAADFCTEGYFYELDLSEILGKKFDSKAIYIAELRAESRSDAEAQLGLVYKNNGEWVSSYFNVFNHCINPYPLFMEALNTVHDCIFE